MLQHLDDLGLAAAAPVEAGHPHQHLVAVQHAVHFLGRQVEVVAALFRHHEAEAVGVAFDAASDQVQFVRQTELPFAVEHQLAIALHRAETALEQVAFGFVISSCSANASHRPGSPHRSAVAGCIHGWAAATRSARPRARKRVGPTDRRNLVFAAATAGFFCSHLR